MLRKITKAVGRYQPGNLHDYPKGVWVKIAADLGKDLDSFSEAIEFNPSHNSVTRGPLKIRRRLGSAAASRH